MTYNIRSAKSFNKEKQKSLRYEDVNQILEPTLTPTKTINVLDTKSSVSHTNVPVIGQNINLNELSSTQGFTIIGTNAASYSGCSVSSAGDINGDGINDIIIGAYGATPVSSSYLWGAAYVIFGGVENYTAINLYTLLPSQGFTIYGAGPDDEIGYSVSGVKDINGDGYDDIIIGAQRASLDREDTYSQYTGVSYVIYGAASLPSIQLSNLTYEQGFAINGANGGDQSGFSVGGIGDANKDGIDDFIIGAPGKNIVYVIFGQKGNFVNISLSVFDNGSTNQGFAVIGVSNTGDNCADNAIGQGDKTGYSVSGAGDVNGDGYADIIIGAPCADPCGGLSPPCGVINSGSSYIIFGKKSFANNINLADLTIDQGFSINGAVTNDYSGWSVSDVGDINRDGYADVIVGAPRTESWIGRSYIIFGRAKFSSNINLIDSPSNQWFSIYGGYSGGSSGAHSGWSVSSAGDINMDGYTDIIIGEPRTYKTSGSSYILYGKKDNFTDIYLNNLSSKDGFAIIDNDNSDDWSGYSVSHAGDVNGDGYDDVIIGAPYAYYNSYSDVGNSYIIFGGIQATPLPSFHPTIRPSLNPTKYPTFKPTQIPTALVTMITNKPILNTNSDNSLNTIDVVLAAVLPTVVGSIVAYFRKAICFAVLDKWGQKAAFNLQSLLICPCNIMFGNQYKNEKDLKQAKGDINEMKTDFEESQNNIDSLQDDMAYIHSRLQDTEARVSLLEDNSISKKVRGSNQYKIYSLYNIKFDNPIINDAYNKRLGLSALKSLTLSSQETKSLEQITQVNHQEYIKAERSSFENSDSLFTHSFIDSFLHIRQVVEYIPIIKYLVEKIIYPLVENHLPEPAKNISLPEILDSKVFLFAAHLSLGTVGAMMLPIETVLKGLIASTAASMDFGSRLAASDYLAEQKQLALSNDKTMNAFEITKYCVSTIFTYTVPAIATCTLAQTVMPGYNCADLDLSTKLSLAGAECYSVYKTTQASTTPTTSDIVVPYFADGVSALSAYAYGYSPMSIVASVVTVDWMSRLAMNFIPSKVKESCIDPIFDYALQIYSYAYDNINQITGTNHEL